MSKLHRLVQLLDQTGLVSAALVARSQVGMPWLTVLTYHRIARPSSSSELDPEVIDATPEQLDAQLALLRQHFRFVSLADVRAWVQGRPLPPNPVLITFDDGYVECLTEALPLLKRHGAPATFFVATGYLSERRLFWWDRLTLLLRRSLHGRIELTHPRRLTLDLIRDFEGSLNRMLALVKTVRHLDLERLFGDLSELTGVSIDPAEERALVDRTLMTWDDVQTLALEGMDLASHTRTHRVLGTLSDRDLEHELSESRRELTARLGRPCEAIAYPVGYPIDARVRRALVQAGYRLGFTNQTGACWTGRRADPFDLRRMSMSRSRGGAMFRALVALPALAPRRLVPPSLP